MNYYKAVFDLGRPVEVKIPEEKDILQKMQADPQFATPPVAYADFQSALELQDKGFSKKENRILPEKLEVSGWVEPEGFEPSSKHQTCGPSTCLFST